MIETKFKNSEVGLIPEDWVAVPLSSIGEVKMCKRILKEQTTESGDVPFYKIGTFGKEPDAFIPRSLYEQYRSAYPYPKKGTILISAAGTIGRTVVFDGADAYFQDSNIVWIDHKEDKVKNSYLEHYFKVISWKSENGGTISRLYNDNLRSTFLCYPKDKDEQSRIATALSDVDELIETLKKLIEKKRNIKKGAMQELLSGKRRLQGFTDKWKEMELWEICDRYDNLRVPVTASLRKEGDTPYYGANGIQDYVEGYTHNGEFILIAEYGANSLTDYPIQYVNGKVWVNNHAHVIKAKEGKADNKYLSYGLKTIDFESNVDGSTRIKLTASKLMQLKIDIPYNILEQQAIAKVLSDMDSEISILESRLTKYQSLKQGMMQRLLTGKIRLI